MSEGTGRQAQGAGAPQAERPERGEGPPRGSLKLDPGIASAIRRHGQETYPNECCGALVGTSLTVRHASPLPNTTEEGARRRFLVRPSDYNFAEDEAKRLKGELLGFYHSHPDAPARPSQYDLDHAWPSFWYVIVSIEQGEPKLMTVWRLADDRSQFREETLEDA
jgi:proteasome lid subunit RPN8/RPN11